MMVLNPNGEQAVMFQKLQKFFKSMPIKLNKTDLLTEDLISDI